MEKEDARFSMAAAEPITKFTGEDMTYSSSKWAQDIEDNAEIFGWTAQQKLIMARRSLSGTAELWLKTEKTFKCYEDLKTALQKEFPEIVNSKQMHEIMAARKKRNNESYYQYMLIMKELGKRAKFPDYVAIQYIVDGITDYEDYVLENDVLYKGVEKKLVIPDLMDVEIIKRAHGIGHFRKKIVKEIVEKDYHISKLDSKIEKVISTCIPCILATRKSGKKEGLLNSIDKGELPLDTLHCDHLGPLDVTKKMYNYILAVIDAYTKFVWIYPVKTLTAKETVDKLKLHQKDYGNPRRIITDRGTAFTGKEFKDYCAEEEIEHITVTTGIPRGNGQVERMNQIIISVLTKMCIDEPNQWYKHVSELQRVINSSYQRSINTSPFELLTGVKLKQKKDLKIVKLLEEENTKGFIKKRDELRREAKAQILKIQEENRRPFNKRRKEGQVYKIGDLVAIQRTQFGSNLKLKEKFLGPYRVCKELGKDRYEIEKIDSSKEGPKKTTTGVDYMKRWL